MKNTFYPLDLDHVHPYAYWNDAFTISECENIIEIGKSLGMNKGSTYGSTDIRNNKVSWIYPGDGHNWIFERVSYITKNLNNDFFKFDIFGLAEGLQFTEYNSPDNEYRKHNDRLFNTPTRKISISIQLSDPEQYIGGDLNLYLEETPTTMPKAQGTLVAFPSFVLHEVKQVTSGTRYSLVAWVTGVPFK